MDTSVAAYDQRDLNLRETELRLGLPGMEQESNKELTLSSLKNNKRSLPDIEVDDVSKDDEDDDSSLAAAPPPAKAPVVGWPPVRSYRKNSLLQKKTTAEGSESGIYVKVSMDGAPYLRKIDLKVYNGYPSLLKALENMFKLTIGEYSEREGYKGSEYAPTYEDKDGDWMLLGDVPWEMFILSCKRLRIMKGSEAKGLGCGV
ncbi:auxin-induced protein IAA4-like [Impatiens glandulifera]|uniref:auxin-induced protein IAA4-like n=1 Tax=Impatiens glandulifera TaxID=253017 RepID=UPI001FB068DB|nr:auxin-induced protein IAA4-like [Impatiens glandulifera]